MMQRLLMVAALLLAVLLATPAWAQRDTSDPGGFYFGRLLEASASELSIEAHDASGSIARMTFGVNAESIIGGCTLDEVKPGTQTYVDASPDAAGRLIANLVKFDGCGPSWHITARTVAVSVDSLTVEILAPSELGDPGTTVGLALTDQTTVVSCSGEMLSVSDLKVDRFVAVIAAGSKDDGFTAVSVTIQDDCPQSMHAEAAFVSFNGEVFTVIDRATNDTLRLELSSIYGRVPDDSTMPIYSCDGIPVNVNTLTEGEILSVVYLVVPGRGSYLQYAQRTQGCPIHLSGKITAREGQSLTIAMQGMTYTGRVTTETSITSCERRSMSIDDITIGAYVQAALVQRPEANTFQSIQLQEGCPYAFYTYGTVTTVDASGMTVDGHTSENETSGTTVIGFDDATFSINCLGTPQSIARVDIGSSVVVYYRISGGQRTADVVIVQHPCEVAPVYGTILEVSDASILIAQDDGSSMPYVYNANTKITNCSGEVVSFDAAMVGASLSGVYATTSKPPMLVSATVNVGCQVISTIGGVITAIEDSSATVLSQGNLVMLNRTPYTAAYDAVGMPVAWDVLRVGDSVCCCYDEQGKLLYRIIAGVDCSLRATATSTSMVGSIVRADNAEVVVEGRAGTMSFAITQVTEMTSTMDRPVVMADLTPGTIVNVMSSAFTRNGQPIASTVAVMSVTSVDEADPAQASLVLFPNPASQSVTIANAVVGDVITIVDQQGKHVLRTTSPIVGVDSLAPGMYTVTHRVGTVTSAAPLIIIR
jgi:hypothetical protein